MKKIVLALSTILLFSTTVFGSGNDTAKKATTNEKPILGFVVLNQTTPEEVKKQLDSMGCDFDTNNNSVIATGCYSSLPGNPKVYFRNILGDKIDLVFLEYQKVDRLSGGPESFTQYVNALKKTYGKPGTYNKPFVGNSFASWNKNNVYVEVSEPHMSFEGWVLYETNDVKKAFDDQEKAKKKQKQNALDLL